MYSPEYSRDGILGREDAYTPSQWIVNPLAASSRAALRTARSSGYSISRSLILAMRRRARPFRWNSLPHGW